MSPAALRGMFPANKQERPAPAQLKLRQGLAAKAAGFDVRRDQKFARRTFAALAKAQTTQQDGHSGSRPGQWQR